MSDAAPPPPRAASVRTPGFIGGVLGTAFAVALGFGLIVPALPAFARELGAGYGATSAVVAVFAAVRLVASGPAGALVDRLGARINVAAGLVIVAVSSAAIALAGSAAQLTVLRGFGGLGSALFIAGIGQHVIRTIPQAERGRANGLLQGAFLLGIAAGPALGGMVVEALGIRAPFLVYAATLVVATGFTVTFLRSTGTAAAPAPTPAGQRPLARLARDGTFWGALAVYLAVSFAGQGARFVGVPLFGEEVLGASPGQIGLALTVSSVGQGIVLWPASLFADRRGRLWPTRAGTVALGAAMVLLAVATDVPGMYLAMLTAGVGSGIASTLPATIVGDLAPPGAEGKAIGLLNVAQDVGAITGPLATGFLAQTGGFDVAFLTAGGLLGLALLATVRMRETLARPGPGPAEALPPRSPAG